MDTDTGTVKESPRDEEVDVFGLTHTGKVREHNEDQFLICSLHKQIEIHQTSLPSVEQIPLKGEKSWAIMEEVYYNQ